MNNCKLGAPQSQRRHYIIDRRSGGFLGGAYDAGYKLLKGNDRTKWFSLRSTQADGDCVTIGGVKRCNFRLHPGNHSKGCITLKNKNDFNALRQKLLDTETSVIPGTNVTYYGTVSVK